MERLAHHPAQPLYLRFSCVLYNKPPTVSTVLSWVLWDVLANYWKRGLWEPLMYNQVGQKSRHPGGTPSWHLASGGQSSGTEPLPCGVCSESGCLMSAPPSREPAHLVSEGLCVEKWFSCNACWGWKDLGDALSPASGHCVCPLSNPSHRHLAHGWAVGQEPGGCEHNASTNAVGGNGGQHWERAALAPSPSLRPQRSPDADHHLTPPRAAGLPEWSWPSRDSSGRAVDWDGLGWPGVGWGGQAWRGLAGQVPSAAVKENLSRPPSWIRVAWLQMHHSSPSQGSPPHVFLNVPSSLLTRIPVLWVWAPHSSVTSPWKWQC